MDRYRLKAELKKLLKCMNYVSKNFLDDEKTAQTKDIKIYYNIYQQLGLAWEFLGIHCRHWEGYQRIQEGKEACRICGKVKGVQETYYILPREGDKIIGTRLLPDSEIVFKHKKEATIVRDTINFYGASLSVNVHNAYRSRIIKNEINIAADRVAELRESHVLCSVDQHLIYVWLDERKRDKSVKYSGFPWEIKKAHLKKFPVIFDFDEEYSLLGLTIIR